MTVTSAQLQEVKSQFPVNPVKNAVNLLLDAVSEILQNTADGIASGIYLLKATGAFVKYSTVNAAITARSTGDVLYLNNYDGSSTPETFIVTGALTIFSLNSTLSSNSISNIPLITHGITPFQIRVFGDLTLIRTGGGGLRNLLRITDGVSTFESTAGQLSMLADSPQCIVCNSPNVFIENLKASGVLVTGGKFFADKITGGRLQVSAGDVTILNGVNGDIFAGGVGTTYTLRVNGAILGPITLNDSGTSILKNTGTTAFDITANGSFSGKAFVYGMVASESNNILHSGSGLLHVEGEVFKISPASGTLIFKGNLSQIDAGISSGDVYVESRVTPASISQADGNLYLTGALLNPGETNISISGGYFYANGMNAGKEMIFGNTIEMSGSCTVELVGCKINNSAANPVKFLDASPKLKIRGCLLVTLASGQDSIGLDSGTPDCYNYGSYADSAANAGINMLVEPLVVDANVSL